LNYKLIYRTFGKPKRGANILSNELQEIDKRIECIDIDDINDINAIRDDSTLVFQTQGIHLYNQKYNFIKSKPTDVTYIRHEYSPALYPNPVNNGFSYSLLRIRKPDKFINKNNLKYFSPVLYNFSVQKINYEYPIIGYYLRPTLTPDSTNWFLDFLNNLEHPVHLYTMGIEIRYDGHPNVIKHTHTYDRFEFFSNVTHYIYFKSNTFSDPLPHSLLEAARSNCQIIVPDNDRIFDDGIDDICSCIHYHNTFNSEIIDNSDSILMLDFSMYLKRLVDMGFLHTTIKDLVQYKDFKEWIVENIQKPDNL